MPAKRDDAAYKSQYREAAQACGGLTDSSIGYLIKYMQRNTMPVYPDRSEARIDAYTDILMERGQCASVLDWHKKPAGDELPW